MIQKLYFLTPTLNKGVWYKQRKEVFNTMTWQGLGLQDPW